MRILYGFDPGARLPRIPADARAMTGPTLPADEAGVLAQVPECAQIDLLLPGQPAPPS